MPTTTLLKQFAVFGNQKKSLKHGGWKDFRFSFVNWADAAQCSRSFIASGGWAQMIDLITGEEEQF